MAYRDRAIPDWEGTLQTLRETLEDVLDTLDMNERTGVRSDITALNVFDQLNQYMDDVKRDLGV